MGLLDLIPGGNWIRLAIVAALVAAAAAALAWFVHVQRDIGRAEVRAEWAIETRAQLEADLIQSATNARETLRRLEKQQENQLALNTRLEAAQRAANANERSADELRQQAATAAQRWRAALRDSPTVAECAAGGDAIGVFADVLGRADRRASVLAKIADTARARGLKCEADYDALEVRP